MRTLQVVKKWRRRYFGLRSKIESSNIIPVTVNSNSLTGQTPRVDGSGAGERPRTTKTMLMMYAGLRRVVALAADIDLKSKTYP